MNLEQALTVIKQALDLSMTKGTCVNLESANALCQAWIVLTDELKDKIKK